MRRVPNAEIKHTLHHTTHAQQGKVVEHSTAYQLNDMYP